ncbi:hypothetical protein MHYP_G00091840 [Metynnis hypsauchen]
MKCKPSGHLTKASSNIYLPRCCREAAPDDAVYTNSARVFMDPTYTTEEAPAHLLNKVRQRFYFHMLSHAVFFVVTICGHCMVRGDLFVLPVHVNTASHSRDMPFVTYTTIYLIFGPSVRSFRLWPRHVNLAVEPPHASTSLSLLTRKVLEDCHS